MEHLQQAIVGLIDHYGYFGLFAALVLGNVGLPVGSELMLPTSGALAATGHLSNVWIAIVVAVIGELVGQSIAYAVGRYGGVPAIEKFGKYVHLRHEHLLKIHAFFERWGTFAIFICRFLPFVRGVNGYAAGVAEMNLAHFYLWTLLGSTVMCGGLILLGYAFGDHLDTILPLLHKGGYALLAIAVAAAIGIYFIWRARARRGTAASSG